MRDAKESRETQTWDKDGTNLFIWPPMNWFTWCCCWRWGCLFLGACQSCETEWFRRCVRQKPRQFRKWRQTLRTVVYSHWVTMSRLYCNIWYLYVNLNLHMSQGEKLSETYSGLSGDACDLPLSLSIWTVGLHWAGSFRVPAWAWFFFLLNYF